MAKWNMPEGKLYTQAEMDAAVAAEREACAKIADPYDAEATLTNRIGPMEKMLATVAKSIRARGK